MTTFRIPLPLALAVLCAAPGCDRPSGELAARTLGGTVYVTGPVEGAVVSVYELDLAAGDRGELLATSEPTDAAGAYVVELGVYEGPLLLEARGPAARYTEPASGAEATFDAPTRLRAFVVDWDVVGESLHFGNRYTEPRADVIISPFTELAVAYADTRVRLGFSATYELAAADSVLLWWDHLEFDFWRVPPRSLVQGAVGPFNERVHAGVLYTGLSHMARRIAVDSSLSPAAVSSLSLLDALELDLADAGGLLDGCGKAACSSFEDNLRIGACPEPDDWAVSRRIG